MSLEFNKITFQTFHNYQLEIQSLEAYIKANEICLDNWIRKSASMMAVSTAGNQDQQDLGIRSYQIDTTASNEITRINSLLEVQRDNLKVLRDAFDKQKRTIKRMNSSLKNIELEIFIAAFIEGLSNREIASRMHYEEKTIKNYKTTIYAKMHNRA